MELEMDIKFEVEGYKFNVRSSCIIKDKNHKHVILTNMRAIQTHEAFILPGGRLELIENSEEAIVRELQEELGITLDCKLISIEEIIVKDRKFHMLEFVYYAEIDDFNIIKNMDDGWDKFKVVNINEIDNFDIRPKTVKEMIKCEKYDNISHNINYDWGEQ